MANNRKDVLGDIANDIPLDVADRDYLIARVLPKINTRGLSALLDAVQLVRRDGKRQLNEGGYAK